MKWAEPGWLFGFALLAARVLIICVIGLGTVTQDKSFGLDKAIGGLDILTGGWAVWAFNQKKKEESI